MNLQRVRPTKSRPFLFAIAIASLGLSIAISPSDAWQLAQTVPGALALIAIGAGFVGKASLSVLPWVLTGAGLVTYVTADAWDRWEPGIYAGALLVIAGAISATYLQRWNKSIADEAEVRSGRYELTPIRGAALVCTAGLIAVGILVTTSDLSDAGSGLGPAPLNPGAQNRVPWPPSRSPYGSSRRAGAIEDRAITESSGLTASAGGQELFWTHNDSGSPTLFCVRSSGRSCGTWSVTDASVVDWEAIDATTVNGRPKLVIGDIGDNELRRESIALYIVDEPRVEEAGSGPLVTDPATRVELSYPDGPRDAEALFVHPETGDVYIIEKNTESRARVFVATYPFDPHEALQEVGVVTLRTLLPAITGADISSDGTRVVVTTYLGVYEFIGSPSDTVTEIVRLRATSVPIHDQRQRESVTFTADDGALLYGTEGRPSTLYITRRWSALD